MPVLLNNWPRSITGGARPVLLFFVANLEAKVAEWYKVRTVQIDYCDEASVDSSVGHTSRARIVVRARAALPALGPDWFCPDNDFDFALSVRQQRMRQL